MISRKQGGVDRMKSSGPGRFPKRCSALAVKVALQFSIYFLRDTSRWFRDRSICSTLASEDLVCGWKGGRSGGSSAAIGILYGVPGGYLPGMFTVYLW